MTETDTQVSGKYKMKKLREHILLRPDSYVGKTSLDEMESYVYDNGRMVKRLVKYVPALYKIFDEGVVNMRDHVERMLDCINRQKEMKGGKKRYSDLDVDDVYRAVKSIKVSVTDREIVMENDGNGIDIVRHEEEGIYIPEMIFFHLLSGSNFDDSVDRTWGGRNGYGAKLIAVLSKEVIIETVDQKRGLLYRQTCRDNMTIIDEPVITKYRKVPFTRISFVPDLSFFGLSSLMDYDHSLLFEKRLMDISATTDSSVSVWFNNRRLEVKMFEDYVNCFIGSKKETKRVHLSPNGRWDVFVALNPENRFEQVSFVNGICTMRGGKHVDHVSTVISNALTSAIIQTKKGLKDLKPQMVKNCLKVFVNATIVNPDFDNQMKDYLTTHSRSFGSKFELEESELSRLLKLGLVESCIQMLTEKSQKVLNKVGGSKKTKVKDEKAVHAKYAGTVRSNKCTLILTEGDSAKTLAVSGLAALDEKDRSYFGIMPLSGKIINVKKVKLDRIADNKEYKRILTMMGLRPGLTDVNQLRYGHIAVMTDADHDGYHIKALLFNMFHRFWPFLLKIPDFFLSIRTPLIKIRRKTNRKVYEYFYSYVEFDEWKASVDESVQRQYDYVYYKGLGTHKAEEAREIFSDLRYVKYIWSDEMDYQWIPKTEPELPLMGGDMVERVDRLTERGSESGLSESSRSLPVELLFNRGSDHPCDISFNLAFNDDLSNYRKDWLFKYLLAKSNGEVDYNFQKDDAVSYYNFINSELIEFSVEDCIRSIPNLMDGMKPSQRKIMYCCLKRNLAKEIKVEQLGGHISEKTNYHHGANSLYEAIILLAQDYVGSNNINMLIPEGQFGTRVQNGKDHASPRYIFTYLNPITNVIFNREDLELLNYIYEEGQHWEPDYYLPVIPMILVNGTSGIGTGWSTDIPSYNVDDIVENIERHLRNEGMVEMTPFYQGFRGRVERISGNKYRVTGVYSIDLAKNIVEVTELPVGNKLKMSFEGYTNYLEDLLEKSPDLLKDVETQYTDLSIRSVVKFQPGCLESISVDKLEKLLKLTATVSTNNMNLYTHERLLKHYHSSVEILEDFLRVRMSYYGRRKEMQLKKLRRDCDTLSEKARFINYEIDDDNVFTIRKKTREGVLELLRQHNFKTMTELGGLDDLEEVGAIDGGIVLKDYDYLIRMPLLNQTSEMVDKLNQERELKETEYERLQGTSTAEMYQSDLSQFVKEYRRFQENWNEKCDPANIKTGKSKSVKSKK